MKTILVTGSKGQLGNEIKGHSGKYSDFRFLFTDVDELDITRQDALDSYFRKHVPDYLVNCAAYTAVDKAENEQDAAFLVNSKAAELIHNCCNRYGSKLIHISTDYVFDGSKKTAYTEEDKTFPQTVYGESKLKAEQSISIKQHIIIRTSWLYSAYGSNFIKTVLRIGRERDKLRIVNDQTGCPTWAGDLASAILEIIKTSEQDVFLPGIYHYCNQGHCTWYELACKILAYMGIQTPVEPITTSEYPLPAKRPAYSVLDTRKIIQAYELQIPFWEESLKRCLDQMKVLNT
jgi:dTDP-4-dehydrorhamnose reductase